MFKLNRILVARDRSTCSEHALNQALQLVTLSGADLFVLHVDVLLGPSVTEQCDLAGESADIQRRLEELAERRRARGHSVIDPSQLHVIDVVERGLSPASTINQFTAEHDIDLILVGTHGRKGLRRILMGSVAEELVRTAPCPVLTVHGSEGQPVRRVKHILVPVDFSDASGHALRHAAEWARLFRAQLRLVHVLEELATTPFLTAGLLSSYDLVPEIEHSTDEDLRQFARSVLGPRTSLRVQTFAARPAAGIVGYAAQYGADLIVMSTHGRTGLDHLMTGSVAERVVRHAHCPVLTLRPDTIPPPESRLALSAAAAV